MVVLEYRDQCQRSDLQLEDVNTQLLSTEQHVRLQHSGVDLGFTDGVRRRASPGRVRVRRAASLLTQTRFPSFFP
ncbi:hypothetical protein EYF80_062318 [Liparis tanakae]|uniref:Uncharacterized protein n=1 Tax=Liparis tanakae TaxID=230148 RepID=A0A4Z2EF36_9TELE|nr:hypothetical protein EYF80_062318 [Liparis tanakae]